MQEVKKTWAGMALAAGAGESKSSEKFKKLVGLKDDAEAGEGGGGG